jgi:hypothetical protein
MKNWVAGPFYIMPRLGKYAIAKTRYKMFQYFGLPIKIVRGLQF